MYLFLNYLQEFEAELMEERKRKMEEDEDQPSGWNRVEIDDTPVDIKVTFTLFQLNNLQVHCNTGELGYDGTL